jgi:putative membrane protein
MKLSKTPAGMTFALILTAGIAMYVAADPISPPDRVGVPSTVPSVFADQILTDLHRGNAKELEMGKLAQAKASTPNVRAYAQTLVTDHEEAQKKVTNIASDRNLSIGEANETSSGETATTYKNDAMAQINTLKGKKFDVAFLKEMIADHTQMSKMLRNAESKLDDAPDVKKLVMETIPVIERHLSKANDLLKQIQKS